MDKTRSKADRVRVRVNVPKELKRKLVVLAESFGFTLKELCVSIYANAAIGCSFFPKGVTHRTAKKGSANG